MLFLLLAVVVAAACLILWKPVAKGLGNFLVEDDGVQKAQAAVVLGGDDRGVRITKAAQLAQAGYVPYVIVDGPKTLVGYESDMEILYAEQKGYPAALFHPLRLTPNIDSTHDEAAFVGNYLKQHNIRKILLVTSNFHTHRAAYLFRKENPGLDVIAIPAEDPEYDPNAWWTARVYQKTFFQEWLKTFAAYLGI